MTGKIAAMVDARQSADTLVVARTDAIAVEGIDAAIERAARYVEAGADVLFVEAPRSLEEMQTITKQFSEHVPLLANMVEGGDTPASDQLELEALGYSIAIFPGGIVRALAHTAVSYYESLHANGSNTPFKDRMFDFGGLNTLLGTQSLLEAGKRYEGEDG